MTIAIFGIIMENFPNICSCLFAFNIILRLARNCHIKQIFENFSFLSTPRRSEFPLRHYLTPLSPFCRTPFFAPRRRAPTFPTLSSTTTPFSFAPCLPYTSMPPVVAPHFHQPPRFRRPARPFFFRFSAADARPFPHTRDLI